MDLKLRLPIVVVTVLFGAALLHFGGTIASAETPTGGIPQAAKFDEKRMRVAVLSDADLLPATRTMEDDRHQALPDTLADAITEQLNAKNRFAIVEREVIRRAFNEQTFTARWRNEGLVKLFDSALEKITEAQPENVAILATLAESHGIMKEEVQGVGTAIGADFLVFGKLEALESGSRAVTLPNNAGVLPVGSRYGRLHLRIVDVAHGTIVAASHVEARERTAASNTDGNPFLRKLASQSADLILDATFPAKIVSATPLLVNRGKVDNVQVGDRYSVSRLQQQVEDDAGISIGRLTTSVGEVVVAEVGPTYAVLRADERDGVAMGDILARPLADARAKLGETPVAAVPAPLPRLAIAPIKISGKQTDAFGASESDKLADILTTGVSEAGTFAIVERARLGELITELDLNKLAEGESIDLSAIGNVDRLLFVTVSEFSLTRHEQHVEIVDEMEVKYLGTAAASLRLVNTKTGAIENAGLVSVKQQFPAAAGGTTSASNLLHQLGDAISLKLGGAAVSRLTVDSTPTKPASAKVRKPSW